MIGAYSRFIWCYKVSPSFISQCLPPFTFRFVFWKSVPLQNLKKRLYLQFVWVTSIIITYPNTIPVLSNHIFRFFLSVSFNDNFVALFIFCLQIFHLQTSQKKWRDTKIQSPICHSRKITAETRESFILALYSACNSRIFINIGTWMFIWRSNFLFTFILRHFLKRYTRYTTFFCKKKFF